jgi:hypothetical protein
MEEIDVVLNPNDYSTMPKYQLQELALAGDKKAERIYFERYGKGNKSVDADIEKNNPNRDPRTGQFTWGAGGPQAGGGGAGNANPETTEETLEESKSRAISKGTVDVKGYVDDPTARTYETDQAAMGEIMTKQGWDKPSLSLSEEEFNAERDKFGSEFVVVYRGGPEGLSNGMLKGEHYVGDGNAGPGMYVTVSADRAGSYAFVAEQKGGKGEVVEMLVPRSMIQSAPDRVSYRDRGGAINPLPAPINGGSRADTIALAANGGQVYSSALESKGGDYVIFNPSAVIVKRKP